MYLVGVITKVDRFKQFSIIESTQKLIQKTHWKGLYTVGLCNNRVKSRSSIKKRNLKGMFCSLSSTKIEIVPCTKMRTKSELND